MAPPLDVKTFHENTFSVVDPQLFALLQVQGADGGRADFRRPQGALQAAAAPLRQQQCGLAARQDQSEAQTVCVPFT